MSNNTHLPGAHPVERNSEPNRTRPQDPPPPPATARGLFRRWAHRASQAMGSPAAFIIALLVIVVWAVTGPLFNYSNTWQLMINTGTTVVTFLMVFLIQNTQNRDTKAIQLKLDELIRGVKGARTGLVNLEELEDCELDALQKEFEELRGRRGQLQDRPERQGSGPGKS